MNRIVIPNYLDTKNRPLPKSFFGRFSKIVGDFNVFAPWTGSFGSVRALSTIVKLSAGFGLLPGLLLAEPRRVLDCFRSTSPPGGNLVDGLPPALSLAV